MSNRISSMLRSGLAAVGLAAYCLTAPAIAAQDLSGHWAIDRDAGDEPADVLEPVTRRSGSRFGGIRAGVSIFGIPVDVTDVLPEREDGGTEPQDELRRELGKLQRHVTESLTQLDIEQSPDELRVVYDDLGIFVYSTGQTVEYSDTTVTTRSRGDRYIVEREVADGPNVTEVFRVDGDGATLHWTVTIELESRRDVTIDRVFVRDSGD